LVLLCIQDLESLLGIFDGVCGWETAFAEMLAQRPGSGSMNDFIAANLEDRDRPATLQHWVEEATTQMEETLFPTRDRIEDLIVEACQSLLRSQPNLFQFTSQTNQTE